MQFNLKKIKNLQKKIYAKKNVKKIIGLKYVVFYGRNLFYPQDFMVKEGKFQNNYIRLP